MTLAEAIAGFIDSIRLSSSTPTQRLQTHLYEEATRLLIEYFSPSFRLNDITAGKLRDFLTRWYLEKNCTSRLNIPVSVEQNSATGAHSEALVREESFPAPEELLTFIAELVNWADKNTGAALSGQCSPTLTELSETLPRAIEVTRILSEWVRERRGAFAFPEFLTSFEEGGHSEYDIDTPGNVGALEGYFQVTRVEGSLIEAKDLISEESVWPIIFPAEVAVLLDGPYVINLELVRTKQGWEIMDCGFTYPPGTEIE